MKSSDASDKTLMCRTKSISHLQSYISCGDTSAQMESELCVLGPDEREKLLRGVNLPVQFPPDHALAIKLI